MNIKLYSSYFSKVCKCFAILCIVSHSQYVGYNWILSVICSLNQNFILRIIKTDFNILVFVDVSINNKLHIYKSLRQYHNIVEQR